MSFWSTDGYLINLAWLEQMALHSETLDRIKNTCYCAFSATIGAIIVRFFLEWNVLAPLANYFGLKRKAVNISENPILEKAFTTNKKIGHKEIQGLAKQLDWTEREIQKWIRKRTSCANSSLDKFTESGWNCVFYSTTTIFGFYLLHDKPCLWNAKECFRQYKQHEFTDEFFWYLMLQVGYYSSMIITQFRDARRKDFREMIIHHFVVIATVAMALIANQLPIMCLGLLIHDISDIPMQAAKMAKYIKKHQLAQALFGVFIVAWIATRLVIFPCKIIYAVMKTDALIPGFGILMCFLGILQGLTIFWTWYIIKVVGHTLISKPEKIKDARSDSEDSSSSRENIDPITHPKNEESNHNS